MDWLKKNKDWLITLAVFLCFGLLLLLYSFYFKEDGKKDALKIEEEAIFRLPSEGRNGSSESADAPALQSTSFFLKPGPAELLEKLEGLNRQEFQKETKNLPGLRIMWPAYFFSVTTVENNQAEVMLDASENGFGVMLLTTIDTMRYPEILTLARGAKIWLAAEITGIDPTGTGVFLLSTEYVRFDDYQPPVKHTAEK